MADAMPVGPAPITSTSKWSPLCSIESFYSTRAGCTRSGANESKVTATTITCLSRGEPQSHVKRGHNHQKRDDTRDPQMPDIAACKTQFSSTAPVDAHGE